MLGCELRPRPRLGTSAAATAAPPSEPTRPAPKNEAAESTGPAPTTPARTAPARAAPCPASRGATALPRSPAPPPCNVCLGLVRESLTEGNIAGVGVIFATTQRTSKRAWCATCKLCIELLAALSANTPRGADGRRGRTPPRFYDLEEFRSVEGPMTPRTLPRLAGGVGGVRNIVFV